MNTKTINTFLDHAAKDGEMARGLAIAVGDKEGHAACAAVAEYAASKGYALTAADVDAGRQAIVAALAKEGALSDEQLESAAGGIINSRDVAQAAAGLVIAPVTAAGLVTSLFDKDKGVKMIAGAAEPVTDFFSKW